MVIFNELRITEIILNFLLFVPLGYLLPVIEERMRFWWTILILGFGFSIAIEFTQLVTHMGCFDVSDLIHNTIGACTGFLLWKSFMKRNNEQAHKCE